MSLYAIASIAFFLLFLICYILYFTLKEIPSYAKTALLGAFLTFGAATHAFLILWGINLFGETAPKEAVLAGGLLGVFLSCCFYYPFAKKADKKISGADMALFLLSGIGFIIDAIAIAYQMLS